MRRMAVLLGLTMVLVVVAAGVALAVSRQCKQIPCRGTEHNDVLHERTGSVKDRIVGLGGADKIEAATFNNDRDRLDGGRNRDRLLTNDGDGRDAARGGRGRDTCLIDQGDTHRSCENLKVATQAQEGVVPQWFYE